MTRIINLPNGHLAVEVPAGSSNFSFDSSVEFWIRYYPQNHRDINDTRIVELLPGQYEIVGKGDSLFNEQWAAIVPRYDGDAAWVPSYNDPDSGGHGYCYEDYMNPSEHSCVYTATASGLSLLSSLSLKPSAILIIKKVK
jgi:hypothetical protein